MPGFCLHVRFCSIDFAGMARQVCRAFAFRLSCVALLSLTQTTSVFAAEQLVENPPQCRGGLVVSVDRYASRIGAEVLREGGNAVDATVATAFALAVTHPEAGNIGGGGFVVVRLANSGEVFTVDYREAAPALATPGMFLKPDGAVDPEKVNVGWQVVGVPGAPSGLWTVHQRAGKLPWKRLVQPAIDLCEQGFVVDEFLARGLRAQLQDFERFGEATRVYYPDGVPPEPGSKLKLSDLGRTLVKLRDLGPDGFYAGPVADAIEAEMLKQGGLIRKSDLAAYRARVRTPVRGTYRGYEIISIAPPSGGGTLIVEMLNILEQFPLRETRPATARSVHWIAEAMKRAYCDRARCLADPDFVTVPLEKLLAKNYAQSLAATIGERSTSSRDIGKDILTPAAVESNQTTHFSVVDGEGNMVAHTTTLEGSYGAKVIVPGTGFLLNNQMHDFNVRPGITDETGAIGTDPNNIAPGKRMLSSQSPTLVLKDGTPFLVLGSPGGRTIPNTVLNILLNVIDHGMEIQAAVDFGRFHHQWMPDVLSLEQRWPESLAAELQSLGHRTAIRERQGDAHCIQIDWPSRTFKPGVDKRLRGSAFGFD